MIETLDHTQASMDRPKHDSSTRTRLARTAFGILDRLHIGNTGEHTRHSRRTGQLPAADLILQAPPAQEKGRHRPERAQERIQRERERDQARYELALEDPTVLLAPNPDSNFGVAHFHPPDEKDTKQLPNSEQKQ